MSDGPPEPSSYPIRFGVGEIVFVLIMGNLEGLGLSALITAGGGWNDDAQHVTCLVLGLTLAGGSAYVALRLATAYDIRSAWKRYGLILGINAALIFIVALKRGLSFFTQGR